MRRRQKITFGTKIPKLTLEVIQGFGLPFKRVWGYVLAFSFGIYVCVGGYIDPYLGPQCYLHSKWD